jgi:hypothetical protein
MVSRQLLDVALVTGLRPAALVVPARCLVELVDELLELAGAQDVNGPALAAHDGDQRAVAAPDERDERRQVELAADRDLVLDRIGERQRSPGVVETGHEHGSAARAVAVEVAGEEIADPPEIVAQ